MLYHMALIDIGFAIVQALRTLVARIAATLYNYVVKLYDVFMIIARADVLDNKYVQLIYNRVGIILGLFMLFRLSFSLIQSLINPDKFSDKKSGFKNIIIRSVVAIVLLGITPSIFKYAREFQNLVVGSSNDTNNVIYRIIVAEDSIQTSNSSFGRTLATDLFFSFFKEKNGKRFRGDQRVTEIDGEINITFDDYENLKESYFKEDRDFGDLVKYMSLYENDDYVFDWDIILSVGVAVAVLWILINYCISVATRVIQLAYLQLVSPIPILSYIGDPEGSFKKWINQCTSTYLDLFIRLAILYFIITLSGKALDMLNDGSIAATAGLENGSLEFTLVKVFIIIGLLMFGKRVPELLKELFPGNGSFDFGVKGVKNLIKSIPGASFAVGAATGAALGSAGRVVGGLAHGAVDMKKAWQQNKGAGWKRGLKTLGFGAKGLGAAAIGGITGGVGGGYRNRKGGFVSGVSGGWSSLRKPIQGDIDSWKKHKNEWSEARQEEKERNRFLNEGRSLYEKYGIGDDISSEAFSSEYAKTYDAKKSASTAKRQAKVDLDAARSKLDAAYANGDADEIARVNAEYMGYQKAFEAAERDYDRADKAHARSQALHQADYRREQAFSEFKKSGGVAEYKAEKIRKEQDAAKRKQLQEAARQERQQRRTEEREINTPMDGVIEGESLEELAMKKYNQLVDEQMNRHGTVGNTNLLWERARKAAEAEFYSSTGGYTRRIQELEAEARNADPSEIARIAKEIDELKKLNNIGDNRTYDQDNPFGE